MTKESNEDYKTSIEDIRSILTKGSTRISAFENWLEELEQSSEAMKAIEDHLAGVKSEILAPVEKKLDIGTKFSSFGLWVGGAGIIISIALFFASHHSNENFQKNLILEIKNKIGQLSPSQAERKQQNGRHNDSKSAQYQYSKAQVSPSSSGTELYNLPIDKIKQIMPYTYSLDKIQSVNIDCPSDTVISVWSESIFGFSEILYGSYFTIGCVNRNGHKSGPYKSLYQDGEVLQEGNYVNGQLTDPMKTYSKDGKLLKVHKPSDWES